MAGFILATHADGAHVRPLIPVARELIRRGHSVWWYTGERYREPVESSGAHYLPPRHGQFVDLERLEAEHPEFAALTGAERAAVFLDLAWAAPAGAQYRDLSAACDATGADVLLADSGFWAANLLYESKGILWATVCQAPMSLPDPDRPYSKELVGPSPMARALKRIDATRAELGMPPLDPRADHATPFLFLQATVPEFEFPRRRLPAHVHFTGPLFPDPPAAFTPPPWWSELNSGHAAVLVTQGTMATRPADLITPAVEALADDDDLLVIATTGRDTEDIGVHPLPRNVRVARFLPYDMLMPKLDTVVASGGYGTVQFAVGHGLPLVVAGRGEDKPATCARVAWTGVGIDLGPGEVTKAHVAEAVHAVLTEENYRLAAKQMAERFAAYDGPRTAASLLERLARDRDPVVGA